MKIYNDSIENAVGVNSTSFGEYIGSAFSSFTPPLNGLMVQGNVGIGTTAPTQNLHVQGNFRLTGSLLDNNNNTGSAGQLLSSTGSGVAWTSSTSLGIVTGSGSINQVTFWAASNRVTGISTFVYNGALGIGTNNPRGSLETANEIYVENIYFGIGNSFTNTLIGFAASDGNFLDESVLIGYNVNDGSNSSKGVIIGSNASKGNDFSGFLDNAYSHVIIGTRASSNNIIRPGGGGKVIIGSNAYSYINNINDQDSGNLVVIGTDAYSGSAANLKEDVIRSTIIGPYASQYASHGDSVIIGTLTGVNTDPANLYSSYYNTIIGNDAGINFNTASYNTIIGRAANSQFPNSVFSGGYNVLLGDSTQVSNNNYQIAIGANATVSKENSGAWGGNTNLDRVDLGIGTFAAAARLHVQTLSSVNNGILVAGGVGQTASLLEVDATLNGATYFIVTGIGSVGVNTSVPTQSLDVNGGVRLRGRLFDNSNSSGSLNQVLISTGTGIAWTTSAATGILTGSGTINTVAKFNTANSLTNSNITDTGTQITLGSASSISGILTSFGYFGPGTNITNLNASNLASGTVPSAVVSGSYSGITSVGTLTQLITSGFATASGFFGPGTFINNLNASNLASGTVPSAVVSGTYSGITSVGTLTQLITSGFATASGFFGPGTFVTNLNASNLASGTVPSAVISGSYSGITSVGTLTSLVVNGIATATTFIGNGTFINLGSVNDAIFNGNNVGRGGGNISGNVLVGGGSALANNSSGTLNSAFGWSALNQNTSESNNSAFGYEAAIYSKASGTTAVGTRALSGTATTSNTGANNTVMGFGAGRYLNSASNVAVGNGALSGSSTAFGTGGANVAIGNQAMNVFTTAVNNVAIGAQALQLVTTGQQCVAVGESALSKNTTGNQNVAIGQRAGFNLDNSSGGGAAVLIGTQAGFTATTVGEITYVGQTAGFFATGGQNVALGAYAMYGQNPGSSGTNNTAIGYAAMNVFTSGSGNVALGQAALNKMTTAGSNVALGYLAQQENLTGGFNIAVGREAMRYYTSISNQIAIGYQALQGSATTALNTGTENVAVGYQAGLANTSGSQNTFIGNAAGAANTSGASNTFVGYIAGRLNTTGNTNTAVGRQAMYSNTSGSSNVAIGQNALFSATTASSNTAVGNQAMFYITTQGSQTAVGANALAGNSNTALNTGQQNTALGNSAGAANTSGSFNVFVGHNAGSANTSGSSNTFVGSFAGQSNNAGSNNTFVGSTAGGNNRSGINNTAVGLSAANQLTTGASNCYLGRQAAYYNISGNDNIAIGENGLFNFETSSNQIAIGRNALFGNNTRALNTGGNNVAVGYAAGTAVTSGIGNVFVGHLAGDTITSGFSNIIIGNQADGTATANYQIALGELVIPTASNLGAWGGNTNSTRTNLGVGTFTPLSRLHIETLAASNLGLYIAGAASQTGNLIEVDATTNGTQLFVVTGIGSVGINTSVASRYLYNQGDTRLNGNVGVLGEPINGYPLSVYGNMYMRQGDVLSWSAGNADISSGSGGAFDLRFRTYDGVSATRENMRIMSNGNVGIGTTGPFARLHVQGLSTTNTPLIISGFGTPTVDLFRIEQNLNGTRYVTVGSAGSVGIGTSLPSQSLHIQNNSRFNGAIFDVNNLPGAPVGIVSQALFSTGTGVTWAPVKRNLVVPLMTAFNPTQVGIDSAIFIVPQDPINGTSSMTFNFRRVNVRVETPSAAGITTINIAKSIGTGAFLGTSILSANINLTGASTYEAFGTSFAVGFTTASSGDKLAINFVGVNTFHQNLTVELIAIEA